MHLLTWTIIAHSHENSSPPSSLQDTCNAGPYTLTSTVAILLFWLSTTPLFISTALQYEGLDVITNSLLIFLTSALLLKAWTLSTYSPGWRPEKDTCPEEPGEHSRYKISTVIEVSWEASAKQLLSKISHRCAYPYIGWQAWVMHVYHTFAVLTMCLFALTLTPNIFLQIYKYTAG